MNLTDENELESTEAGASKGYQIAYDDLIASGNYSPRKAKRYLDSISKRKVKKVMKGR